MMLTLAECSQGVTAQASGLAVKTDDDEVATVTDATNNASIDDTDTLKEEKTKDNDN